MFVPCRYLFSCCRKCIRKVVVMAFNLKCTLPAEYRGMQTGVSSKSGKQWMTLIFEDEDCNQLSVSVPSEMFSDIYNAHLQKGDLVMVAVRAVARADGNSYIMLDALPEFVIEDED